MECLYLVISIEFSAVCDVLTAKIISREVSCGIVAALKILCKKKNKKWLCSSDGLISQTR